MMILSIDVEDYFMVEALSKVVKRADWDRYPLRVERSTHKVLDLVDEMIPETYHPSASLSTYSQNSKKDCTTGLPPNARVSLDPPFSQRDASTPDLPFTPQKATFFCVGWVAEHCPGLIREIHSRGHEVACHGFDHRMITTMTPGDFRQDIRKAKVILEDITGQAVVGYRAPSYSITRKNLWALEILAEEGFLYDSSVFPVHHDLYGMPDAPRTPFVFSWNGGGATEFLTLPESTWAPGPCGNPLSGEDQEDGKTAQEDNATHSPEPVAPAANKPWRLLEFPLSTLRLYGQNIPVAGGGYFRAFPLWFTLWAQSRTVRQTGSPFIFYLHPWELDPEQPRVRGLSTRSSFRHYLNLHKTENRLRRFLLGQTITSFKSLLSGPA